MLTIPEPIKTLYRTDGVRKNFRVSFPNGERGDICNGELVKESARFTESLCSREVFRFGLCEASSVEFETVGVGNYYGATIRCAIEIDTTSLTAAQISAIQAGSWDGTLVLAADSDIGYGFFRIPLGEFRVESCPRNQEALTHRRYTAYTPDFGRRSSTQPGLPAVNVVESISADPALWLAQVTGEGLTTVSNAAQGERSEGKLFDVGGTAYQLRVFAANGTSRVYPTGLGRPGANAAFWRCAGLGVDYDAYTAVGQEIAEALESDFGMSFCYDGDGERLYGTIAEALRDVYPYLFYPALIAVPLWYNGSTWTIYSNPVFHYRLENGKRYPIMQLYGQWGYDGGEIWPVGRPTGDLVDKIEYTGEYFSGSAAQSVSLYNLTSGQAVWSHTLSRHFPAVTDPTSVVSEKLASPSGYEVRIDNTGDAAASANYRGGLVAIPRYSYAGAVTPADMVSGWLELQAAFGKVERDGGLSLLRLGDGGSAGFSPGGIAECWWDEIDVAPIGTVRFRFRGDDEEQTVEYQFGSGESLYDMSDNAVLKQIDLATADEVLGLLDTQFIPRLGAVGFTPLELSARGLPWIEDGDALSVEAEDGTIVTSYALRRELSGVQILFDNITSAGGNLRESEGI